MGASTMSINKFVLARSVLLHALAGISDKLDVLVTIRGYFVVEALNDVVTQCVSVGGLSLEDPGTPFWMRKSNTSVEI